MRVDKPPKAVAVVDEGVAEQMRLFGFSQESVKAEQAKAQAVQVEQDFEVWDENWDSWMAFMRSQTQWLYRPARLGGSIRIGLNHTGVESGLRMAGLPRLKWPGIFDDLVQIELAVLQAEAEMREEGN